MAITVANVLATPQSVLDDPSGVYWTATGDLIPYLNNFLYDIVGRRRDKYPKRVTGSLVSGEYQSLPADGLQFLQAYAAANGQRVQMLNIEDLQHSGFAGPAATASANPKIVFFDVRDPTHFRVWPPNTGSGTLDYLYGAIPAPATSTSDSYPFGSDTVEAAGNFILAKAFDKNTERRDEPKSKMYYQWYEDWCEKTLVDQVRNTNRDP